MALFSSLRKTTGMFKNRLASAIGSLRGVTVSGTKIFKGARFAVKGARLGSPLGLAFTAATFAPQIGRLAGRLIPLAKRAVAFKRFPGFVTRIPGAVGVAGVRGAVGGAVAGSVIAGIAGRSPDGVSRPIPASVTRPSSGVRVTPRKRRKVAAKPRTRRKAAVRHRHKVISVPIRRRKKGKGTHSKPRHGGHKRVSFVTADGKKVSFLANPKRRHR